MSDAPAPPPLPKKPPIGPVFWVVLLAPVVLTVVARLMINGPMAMSGFLLLLGSIVLCPLYCGSRLALYWAKEPGARVLLGLGLCMGFAIFYLAVAFAGCMTAL